jgi:hypothetical protein
MISLGSLAMALKTAENESIIALALSTMPLPAHNLDMIGELMLAIVSIRPAYEAMNASPT